MRAMILAAGKGERMRPLTLDIPKPLVMVGGRPLIDYHLENLAASGVRDVVINHSWLGDKLVNHIGNGQRFGVCVQYSAEPEPLETLGGIVQALDLLGDEFIVINGDVFCDYDVRRLLQQKASPAHLVLVDNPPHHPTGDFALNNGMCRNQTESRYTFSGIARYRREFFAACRAGKAPLAPLLREQIDMCLVSGEYFSGFWSDVGTVQRWHECDQYLQQRSR